jgi:hypothetical protein
LKSFPNQSIQLSVDEQGTKQQCCCNLSPIDSSFYSFHIVKKQRVIMPSTEHEIKKFAEKLYEQFIHNFQKQNSPFLLLMQDNAIYPKFPGIKPANIRNVLIGGESSGTASFSELITARALYDAPFSGVVMKMSESRAQAVLPTDFIPISFTLSDSMSESKIIDHLVMSTGIIITRIWSPETIQKYVRGQGETEEPRNLSRQVIRALFGIKRRQQVKLYKLQMPIHKRILLLNTCIQICNTTTKTSKNRRPAIIDVLVAERAYQRIIVDPFGTKRPNDIELPHLLENFPIALENAIEAHGYIDEWALKVNFDATIPPHSCCKKRKIQNAPKVLTKKITYNEEGVIKSFWFMTITNSFSDPFWKAWTTAIDEMRFCVGLGGKGNAFVRCSSNEDHAIFTTGGKYTYHALPLSTMEEKILSLAKFVMAFQRAYVERCYGSDYKVTWDANLLHHVVGPITAAVYSAHSDYSPLLCSPTHDHLVHIDRDVYLPTREDMQVLTVYCSNYNSNKNSKQSCTTITYKFNNKKIQSVNLGAKGIHIQGPGSQAMGIKHEVSVDNCAHSSGIYRCICTTRLSVVPKHGHRFQQSIENDGTVSKNISSNIRLIESHNQVGVISSSSSVRNVVERYSGAMNNEHVTGTNSALVTKETRATTHNICNTKKQRLDSDDPISEKQDHLSECSINTDELSTLAYTECYPNVPINIYDRYGIVRFSPKIIFQDRIRLLTSGPALLCFLRMGYKVYVRKSDGNLYPCLYEINDGHTRHGLLEYGHRFPAMAICADAKLLHKDRVHVPIQSSELSGNIIVLTHKYKQCPIKMNAILSALDEYNSKEAEQCPHFIGTGFGAFDGKLSVMGSGGSHKVQGHFAPTSRCHKNDPLIVVGTGQNRFSPINKKLDQLAADNSVRAIFLNEKYYFANQKKNRPPDEEQFNHLRFLGYYQFDEIRYVSGDTHEKVAKEFNNPSVSEWGNLTFRLHRHLRLEASPFIPTMDEVHKMYTTDSIDFQKLVFNHDDHSSITYYIRNMENWKTLNHEITVEDVIKDMVERGDINRHIEETGCSNADLAAGNMSWLSQRVDISNDPIFNGNNVPATKRYIEHSRSNTNLYESDQSSLRKGDDKWTNDNVDSVHAENNLEDSCSDYMYESDSLDNGESSDQDDMNICHLKNIQQNDENNHGTVASVADIVYCAVFASAACSMRFNQDNLVNVDGKICAAPLKEGFLGSCLRTRPIPSPNRTLDVNLCYLRYVFKEHLPIHNYMNRNHRCPVNDIPLNVLTEMLFQAILLRYTGRIYCFEEYRQHCIDHFHQDMANTRSVPFREECSKFLEYVQLHMVHHKRKNIGGWISKQHDISIAYDLRTYYKSFSGFVRNVANCIGDTLKKMLHIAGSRTLSKRTKCIAELQSMLQLAMMKSSVSEHGRVKWMAYVSVCDLEEFVLDPFGPVDETSVPEGIYSREGHDMVNRGRSFRISFEECLKEIVSFVQTSVPLLHLRILGYEKECNSVVQLVNRRPFSPVDAEHFLCKAWIVAKSTYGCTRLSKYPKLTSAHTHPSPTIHCIADDVIETVMTTIESAYMSLNASSEDAIKLPELCQFPEEEVSQILGK